MSGRRSRTCRVLTAPEPRPISRQLAQLVRICGVRAVPWQPAPGSLLASLRDAPAGTLHVAADAGTLHGVLEAEPDPSAAATLLRERGASLTVVGLMPDEASDAVLRLLLGASDVRCLPLNDAEAPVRMAADRPELTGALGGGEFTRHGEIPARLSWLEGVVPRGARPLMTVAGRPIHATLAGGAGPLHLVAVSDVLDPDQFVGHSFELDEHVPLFAPLALAVRDAFGDSAWHRADPVAAMVVDDPSLRPRHGCLRFDELLADMKERDYAVTIGFIPLNVGRTHRSIAQMFQRDPRHLSICIHGCYHTRHEFGHPDPDHVEKLARTARRMLEEHEEQTGVPFARVMVFPHGVFTRHALVSLRRAGYAAAVNSHIHPRGQTDDRATIGEHLALAMAPADGVPLFRRHPAAGPLSAFRVQAFLGHTVLIGAHHDICRAELSALREFVDRLADAIPGIRWESLGTALRRSYLQRRCPDGRLECLVTGGETLIENRGPAAEEYRVIRRVGRRLPTPRVLADGREVSGRRCGEFLVLPLRLEPGQSLLVRFDTDTAPAAVTAAVALEPPAWAAARRRACELWDDLVSHDPGVLPPFIALKNRFSRGWSEE